MILLPYIAACFKLLTNQNWFKMEDHFLRGFAILAFHIVLSTCQDATLFEYSYYGGRSVLVRDLSPGKCETITRTPPITSSVKVNIKCVRIWANRDCTGRYMDIMSPGQQDLARNNFDDLLASISNCDFKDEGVKENAEITIHLNGANDLAEHAKKIHQLLMEWFPVIQYNLMSPYYLPVRKIEVHYDPVYRGMFAIGNKIYIPQSVIRKDMNMTNTFIHELTHVIQQAGWSHQCPDWMVEGMAEYFNHWIYQPIPSPIKPTNPKLTNAYLGYWLIAYLDSVVGRPIVYMMNRACHTRTYSEDLLTNLTGKDVNEWWKIMVSDNSFPWKRR